MKNFSKISVFVLLVIAIASCGPRRDPGSAYMPDMAYSVAYETYTPVNERLANSAAQGGNFDRTPTAGTVARGGVAAYPFANDSAGYVLSAQATSPLGNEEIDFKKIERLYLVNCAICHGAKLDGNGPIYKDGSGPYSAAPRNLLDDYTKALKDGTLFHSITFGRNQMGAYSSQLTSKERWEMVAYIRSKQSPGGVAVASEANAVAADSTGTKGK